MRDENGFKWWVNSERNISNLGSLLLTISLHSHVQSESHVRQVLLIGEDPKKYIEDYSRQFLNNFLNLLKTTHGEKKVHANQFYQQVIADKEVSAQRIYITCY